jgi:tRNA-specific 2-thiouridylase
VIDDFLQSYTQGITPNPCVRCNERVKIQGLMALAESRGIHHVATGHYVRVHADYEGTVLCRSADLKKDQSYFLYRLKPAWLSRLLFPVGSMHKAEVWREAEAMGLPVDELKESQEICFVSHGDYRTFLEKETPEAKKPGAFVDGTGSPLGQHEGIAFYTPGQRRGLGVSTGRRLYVQQVEPATNTVVLGPEEALYRDSCQVGDLNLFTPSLLDAPTEVTVKVRYATPAVKATLQPIHPSALRIQFHEPQRALSPGQSAVFYRDDKVLGGGIIQPY